MIKRIDFILDGSVDFSLTDADIWKTKLSAKKMTSTSDYSLVPQRLEFSCVYDANIAKLFNTGNEFSDYSISKFFVKYYEDGVIKLTGIIDLGLIKRDYRSNTVDIRVYDYMKLLQLMNDITTRNDDGSAQIWVSLQNHLDDNTDGWFRKIEAELEDDIALSLVNDSTQPTKNIYQELFEIDHVQEAINLGADEDFEMADFYLGHGTVIQDWGTYCLTIFWGIGARIPSTPLTSVAFARVIAMFDNIQTAVDYDYFGFSSETSTGSNGLNSFLSRYGLTVDDPDVFNLNVNGGAYRYINDKIYWDGEFYPDTLTVSKYPEKFRNSQSDKYVRYYDILKAGLLLYNYFLYVDADGNFHLENKDNDSTPRRDTITITDDDVFNREYIRLNKQEVPLGNFRVLSGYTELLEAVIDEEYADYFQQKIGITCTIKDLTYNLHFLDQITVHGINYIIAEIGEDIDANEYNIKAWAV